MNTWVKVARFNLVRPANYLVLPWILPFSFAVGAVTAGRRSPHDAAGYLLSFFIYFAVQGMQLIGRSLPFGLALGVSRRSFYSGTALLGMALALVSGLVLAALQAIERATGGWGLSMHFFRVPYLLNGPWYATWLTSAVGLFALFVYGMWYGIVHLRWGTLGTLGFIAVQVLVVVAGGVVVAFEHWHVWSGAGGTSAGLTARGLPGSSPRWRRCCWPAATPPSAGPPSDAGLSPPGSLPGLVVPSAGAAGLGRRPGDRRGRPVRGRRRRPSHHDGTGRAPGGALSARTLRQLAELIADILPAPAPVRPGPRPAPAVPGDRWAVLRSLLESA